MCICLTVIFCVQRRDAQHKEIFSPELIAGGAQPGTDRKLVLSKTKLGIQGFCTYSVFKIIVGFFSNILKYILYSAAITRQFPLCQSMGAAALHPMTARWQFGHRQIWQSS